MPWTVPPPPGALAQFRRAHFFGGVVAADGAVGVVGVVVCLVPHADEAAGLLALAAHLLEGEEE